MKKTVCIVLIISSFFALNAFEWSQNPVEIEESFSENRGDCFNTGIVYADDGFVFVAETGNVIISLKNQDTMGLFNSPLGNSVILVHDNNMMSVYSNLDKTADSLTNEYLPVGEVIAESGNSSWHPKTNENKGSSFKVIDTERQTAINPMILMKDKVAKEYIQIKGLKAIDRRGKTIDLYNGASIEAGQYTLYMQRPQNTMIHESQVSLNGEVKETIAYDSIIQSDDSLTVQGNRNYTYSEIYPDSQSMRLADVLLQRGSNTIEILLSNNGDSQTHNYYRINVK